MAALRSLLCSIVAALMCSGPAQSMPLTPTERIRIFATCAGRLSAWEEHQRMFDGPGSERTANTLSLFDDVIDALLPFAEAEGVSGRAILHLRIEAKLSHAMLLQTATFGTDPRQSALASGHAGRLLAACERLMLGA